MLPFKFRMLTLQIFWEFHNLLSASTELLIPLSLSTKSIYYQYFVLSFLVYFASSSTSKLIHRKNISQ